MMAGMITLILTGLLRGVRTQRSLVLENLALRHQLVVLQRTTTSTSPVGACASVRWNPLLGGSARSQGGPRWVSVVSEAHDQGPQPVPRYLDRLNGSDN